MTDEQTALARRAVACPKWRLMPGMLTDEGRRVMHVWPDDLGIHWSHIPESCVVRDADALPDLTDPATLGCLLALVREAWAQPEMCCGRSIAPGWGVYLALVREAWGQDDVSASRYKERWCVEVTPPGGLHYVYGDTEAEALVAALEAAP